LSALNDHLPFAVVCIVGTVMDELGASSLPVSDRGLGHGVLVARFGWA